MESRTIVRYNMLEIHFEGGSYPWQFYRRLKPTATAVPQNNSVLSQILLCCVLGQETIKTKLVKWQVEGGITSNWVEGLPLTDFNKLWICHLSVLQQNAQSFKIRIYLVRQWWSSRWASLRNWDDAKVLNDAVQVWQNYQKGWYSGSWLICLSPQTTDLHAA